LSTQSGGGLGSEIEGQQAITAIAAGGDQLHPGWHLLAHGLAQLAGGSGEENPHAMPSPSIEY
jgi:hypothetical protein